MAKNKSTPEEQLLDLIEKGEGLTPPRPKRKKISFFAFLPFLKRTLRAKLARLKSSIKEPNIKVLNRVLAVISVPLFGYLIADFTFRRPDINQISERISTARRRGLFKEDREADVHPFLYYLEMVQRRNTFLPVVLKSVESFKAEAERILTTLVGDLKLVGISWGEEPQAMIEDKKTKKTYFLKTGDMINKLKIDTILKDRVILNFQGERAELM